MRSLTRRSFLKAASALAFVADWPGSAFSGLLDRIFRPQQARRTPSITPNEEFYVTSYRSPPTIRIGEWALLVTGLVERPITLTYDQLLENCLLYTSDAADERSRGDLGGRRIIKKKRKKKTKKKRE